MTILGQQQCWSSLYSGFSCSIQSKLIISVFPKWGTSKRYQQVWYYFFTSFAPNLALKDLTIFLRHILHTCILKWFFVLQIHSWNIVTHFSFLQFMLLQFIILMVLLVATSTLKWPHAVFICVETIPLDKPTVTAVFRAQNDEI